MSLAIRTSLAAAIQQAFIDLGLDSPAVVNLERPARREHGDWSSNVALASSKLVGKNPRELATMLKGALDASPPAHVTAVEIAGPGFLNFRLAPTWLHDVINSVLDDGVAEYGKVNVGGGRTVNVEYVSANPTGPLHAGHARWAAYGDALSRVLARAGFVVHREFYINDRGVQMQRFGESLAARKAGTEVPEGGYVGQYIRDWAELMPSDADPVEWGYAHALAYQKATLKRMNVEFDSWSSERAIADSGAVEETLNVLRASGHVYESTGTPAPAADSAESDETDQSDAHDDEPANEQPEGESKGMATWLRTTDALDAKGKQFDDKDRVLVKSDGMYTYLMPDIAFHRDKFNRGSLLINILGADHHGYIGRMKAAIMFLGHDPADLEILIGQNCVLMRGGVEVKLSKRTGDILELAEIIDEVGADVAKLTFLLQSIDTKQTVDLDELVDTKLDNPVHYIHYAHARVHGIGRKAAERGIVRVPRAEANVSLLLHERELEVARVLGDLPDVLAVAATDRAPHKITTWIRELASTFQGFYRDCKILAPDVDDELRQARLWLVEASRIGLSVGLSLLGVSAPEQMERFEEAETDPDSETPTTSH